MDNTTHHIDQAKNAIKNAVLELIEKTGLKVHQIDITYIEYYSRDGYDCGVDLVVFNIKN